jgi:hypothetical protein
MTRWLVAMAAGGVCDATGGTAGLQNEEDEPASRSGGFVHWPRRGSNVFGIPLGIVRFYDPAGDAN